MEILMLKNAPVMAILFFTLTGCVSVEQTTSLPSDYYSNTNVDQVTIVTTNELPAAGMFYPGANCLLCLGTASAANSKLSSQVKTFDYGSLENISEKVAEALSEQGLNTKPAIAPNSYKNLKKFPGFSSQSNFARLDFRPLKEELGADRLVWVTVINAGITRSYASYIPISEPVAFVSLNLKMIDLTTNELIVNYPIYASVPADGAWNEAPAFPGLTTAFYQAISDAESKIGKALKIEL